MSAVRGDGTWSGAQVVQHLGKVEGSTAKYMEGIFSAALGGGLAQDTATSSMLGVLDRLRAPDGAWPKLVAPERLVPDAAPALAENWASLQQVRERLFRAWVQVDGRDLVQVTAPHPRLGTLNGYEWLLFIGKHEERHVGQIRKWLATA
jgi:hypothetical protein